MKNLLLFLLLCPFMMFSQDDMDDDKKEQDFNKFSVELNIGQNVTNLYYSSPLYYQAEAGSEYPFANLSHFDLGLRYMFNEKFGVKVSGAYDLFEENGDQSLPFETNLLRFNLEGVVNFRSLLNFDSFTKRFGLLGHAGMHYGFFNPESNNGVDISLDGDSDELYGFVVGLTPQYKISDRVVITADASFINNYRQHRTWDGLLSRSTNLNSEFFTFSLGLTVNLGKHDVHADWFVPEEDKEMKEELANLNNKVDELESKVDAIEPYDPTVVPAAVQNYVTNYVDDSVSNFGTVESLISDEYIRFFFDFDEDMPNDSSVGDISTLVNFLKNNEDQNIVLIGMTDTLGQETYNDDLSLRRSKNVNDILVAAGIDQSRIEYEGKGVNPVYNSKNEYIRMLARTVTVKLK